MIVNLLIFSQVSAQYKYSIDIEERKGRRIPLKFFVNQKKEQFKQVVETNKQRRIADRVSRKISNRTYRIQTATVRKRMRKSKKRAENHNKGKIPFSVKFKRLLNG